jgi:hypothetical protein
MQSVQFDYERRIWMFSGYREVLAALRDRRLSVGQVDLEFREAVIAALASVHAPLNDLAFRELSGEVDLVSELARPWSSGVASGVTGLSGNGVDILASHIFASAANPFDVELRLRSERATVELARRFEGPLRSFWVQAFVALSQSLPAFLGNAWLALLKEPFLMGSPSVATEELLRYAGPSLAQFRTATEDVQFGDAHISRGDRIALMLGSANRDPEIFPNADRLDLQRRPNPHLAFGAGAHSCVGAALIRLVAPVAISKFVEYVGDAEFLGFELSDGFAIRSVRSLRIRR